MEKTTGIVIMLAIIGLLGIVCIMNIPTVLGEGKVGDVTSSWSSKSVRQDESGYVDITIYNTGEDQIRIKKVGIHFDWMETDLYYFDDHTSDPVMTASGQSQTFNIIFSVEKDVPEGLHGYQFLTEYEEDDGWMGWSEETWKSQEKFDFEVLEKDRDGDGVGDSEDAFPDNPHESKDSDQDGVGDNQDAFPMDPLENKDSDNDGIGDNSDNYDGPGSEPPEDPSDDGDTPFVGLGFVIGTILVSAILIRKRSKF